MPDRLIVSDIATDELDEFIVVDALESTIAAAGLSLQTIETKAVTNEKSGEDEEERTYFVRQFDVATVPEDLATLRAAGADGAIECVHSCSCPGFKYHRLPSHVDLKREPKRELAALEECKHIEEVRRRDRLDET